MVEVCGYVVFRYRDKHYIWFSSHDSYPLSLGEKLVACVPTDRNEFKEWTMKCTDILDSISLKATESHLHELLPDIDHTIVETNQSCYPDQESVSDNHPVIGNEPYVKWMYTYDFDHMAFSVDDAVHLRLDNIPRDDSVEEWQDFLDLDYSGQRCLGIHSPPEYLADMHPVISISETGLQEYEMLLNGKKLGSIGSSTWMNSSGGLSVPTLELTRQIAESFIVQFRGRLENAYRYAPSSERFRNHAAFLLRISTPHSFNVWIRDEPCINHLSSLDIQWGYTSEEYLSDRLERIDMMDGILLSGYGDGAEKFFWFRGCLILLSSRLDSEEHMKASIGSVVLRVRQKGLETCTALIWSIRHIVVVSVSSFGEHVAHSAAVRFLDAFWDVEFEVGIKLLMYYLKPPCIDFPRRATSSCSLQTRQTPVPFDIQLHIMKLTDLYTYERLGRVSRALRREWAMHPRIDRYVLTSCGSMDEMQNYLAFNAREDDGPLVTLELWPAEIVRPFHGESIRHDCIEDCRTGLEDGEEPLHFQLRQPLYKRRATMETWPGLKCEFESHFVYFRVRRETNSAEAARLEETRQQFIDSTETSPEPEDGPPWTYGM